MGREDIHQRLGHARPLRRDRLRRGPEPAVGVRLLAAAARVLAAVLQLGPQGVEVGLELLDLGAERIDPPAVSTCERARITAFVGPAPVEIRTVTPRRIAQLGHHVAQDAPQLLSGLRLELHVLLGRVSVADADNADLPLQGPFGRIAIGLHVDLEPALLAVRRVRAALSIDLDVHLDLAPLKAGDPQSAT